MAEYVRHGGIKVAQLLHDLVRDEIAPGTGVEPDAVWTLLDTIVRTLGPRNRALLEKRDALQAKIDAWLAERRGGALDPQKSAVFLREIGYLVPDGPPFEVTTANVDPEIATLAGPQLVLQQLLGQRAAVDRDELPLPPALVVNVPGEELLPGAGLAADQHRHLRRRDPSGNIRELQNVIVAAAIDARGRTVRACDLRRGRWRRSSRTGA